MGRAKKGNRTKGNTRPSNSEHSAHLLSLSGKSFSGFIGFDTFEKDKPSYIPVTGQHSSDTSDLSVDPDLRMVMRKMMKKDSVTRLKAMQEFGDLCSEKEKDNVKNVLPFWPRLFNKLALDNDRRVREATHQANGKLISNVKRDVAPYLKNIMGVWLLGQNDLHAPAASAAQTTFSAAFPPAKQSEALMYCKNEIFAYFKDNLFEQTAKTMSDSAPSSAEDVENKYTLVISATLQALKLFLATISSKEIPNVHDDYLAIISGSKFWKYAKNKEPQIRGSWYALISALCCMRPSLFAGMEKKLVAAVFGCLSETDPVIAPSVWETALQIVVNFDNCWEGININKVVLPQLWTLLNVAGKGNADILYPCILPFLSKFPRNVISKETFTLQFFTCLKNSLFLASVKLSPTECDAVLTTFIECLLYISFNILDKPQEGCALLEKVFSDHVFPLVEISLFDSKSSHLATSKFYSQLGSLVRKLEIKCLNENEEASEAFSQILNLFWDNVYNIFNKFFDKKDDEKYGISIYLGFFFHSILSLLPPSLKSEKNKVRFEDESESEDQANDAPQVSHECLPTADLYEQMPITLMQMIRFISLLCSKIDESVDIYYLKVLDEILLYTLSTEFLREILKSFEETHSSCEKTTMIFFNKFILKWVSKEELNYTSVSFISSIVLNLCSSVSKNEALVMLNACCEAKNPIFLECILKRAFEVSATDLDLKKWLRSSALVVCISHGLVKMIESLAKRNVKLDDVLSHKTMFLMYVAERDCQDILSEYGNIGRILLACKKLLQSCLNCKDVDDVVEMGCSILEGIVKNCKVCWEYDITDELLTLLFHWDLHSDTYGLSEESCSFLSSVWCSALYPSYTSYVGKKGRFVKSSAEELNSYLMCLDTSEKASTALSKITHLLRSVEDIHAHALPKTSYGCELNEILEIILPSDEQWGQLRRNLFFSSVPSFFERKIMYPSPEKEDYLVSLEGVNKLFFTSKVISEVFSKTSEKHKCCYSDFENYFELHTLKHMPDLFWCLSYCSGNGYMNKDFEGKLDCTELEAECLKTLYFLPFETLPRILNDIFHRAMHEGLYWSLPLDLFMEKMKLMHSEDMNQFRGIFSEVMLMEGEHASLNSQILSHYIDADKKVFFVRDLLLQLTELDCSLEGINDDYLRKLGEVCCCIQGCEDFEDDVKKMISAFFNTVLTYDCSWDWEFLLFLQITSFVSSVVQCSPDLVTKEIWDYLQSNLSRNIKIAKSVEFDKPDDLLLLFQVSFLYSTLFSFICATKDTEISWTPIVTEELSENFISLFIHIGAVIKRFNALPQAFETALLTLLKAIKFVPGNILLNYVIKPPVEACTSKDKNDKLSNPIDSLLSILLSDIQYLQLAAHLMLMKIMPLLSESLSSISKSEPEDNEEEEEKVPSKLLPLVDTLKLLNELMEGMLWDFKIGECCIVVPNTEPYAFVSAYMFAWLQMLEFISKSPSQVRSGCVAHLEEEKLLSSLFSNMCRLMPENPMYCLKKIDTPKKENLTSLFLQTPVIAAGDPSSLEIQTIACYTFCSAIRKVPASVRTWWNNLDKKSADIVNKFTFTYISGILCTEEILAVHNNENLFKNMVVKARMGTREVIATYTVDDFAIELCVKLPANYPLGPITAEKQGKIIIAQQECRHWLMQLTTVLNYQNGSILDGLNLWKKNLDKKFEGVEECMICYYILHSSSLKLPKLSCPTCKKKFHSNCLYKWFRSINNTKCPLCRNEFTI